MSKKELQQRLQKNHLRFIHHIRSLSDFDFLYVNQNKWTAGQQVDHIIKSIAPVNLAFSFPGFLLRILFGKANRPSRTFEALVEKYKLKLEAGGRATSRFIPHSINLTDREKSLNHLQDLTHTLISRINSFSEEQLDTLILPHPLLGKLTLREMLYFTIHHVEHHEIQVMKNLEKHLSTP